MLALINCPSLSYLFGFMKLRSDKTAKATNCHFKLLSVKKNIFLHIPLISGRKHLIQI